MDIETLKKVLEKEKQKIGGRLKLIRGETNQSDFAQKFKVNRSMVSRLENGETPLSPKNFDYICTILGLNPSWLLTGEGDRYLEPEIAKTPEEREVLGIFRQMLDETREHFLDIGRKWAIQAEAEKGDS